MKKIYPYTESDREAIKILNGFLPNKIFDAHAHILDRDFAPNMAERYGDTVGLENYKAYFEEILCKPKKLRINMIIFPDEAMSVDKNGCREKCDAFIKSELSKDADNVGEIMVWPDESADDIEKRLTHPQIKGLKCYYFLNSQNTFDSGIEEYLPESAWEVADKKRMYITLHMVRNTALADDGNQKYILQMAKKYPNATLILAHAACGFASWTAVESVEKISHLENILFDFSAVCEPSAIFQIIKKAGLSRCMWGSDFPVCTFRGKSVSLGNSFYWLPQESVALLAPEKGMKCRFLGIENLMAVREACILAELSEQGIEDLFYNNAARLFA